MDVPERANCHASLLWQLVEDLHVRYAHERSVRLCPGAVLANRLLLTLSKAELGEGPREAILPICRRLSMPAAALDAVERQLAAAKFIHFGFEENRHGCLFKLYLEFGFNPQAPGKEVLLHRAFKWEVGGGGLVETKYVWYPGLSVAAIEERLQHVYRGTGPSLETACAIVRLAGARAKHDLSYLEVNEEANARRSFDLNVYDVGLRIQDLEPWLRAMCDQFGIAWHDFAPLYDAIHERRFGHLAGGTHRGGEDFFNLYYGVEWREAKGRTVRTGWDKGAMKRLETTTDQDQYYNYCWWPYLPVAPTENKWRAESLLRHSFEAAGLDERAGLLVETIQQDIGRFRTVWGVKWLPAQPTPSDLPAGAAVGGRLGWEYYFYDYQRRQRTVSITRVLETIRALLPCGVRVNENLPYFMFSLDISAELLSGDKRLDVVHMYLGNPGSKVSSGVAYAMTETGHTLENFYFFFDAQRDLREAAEKLYCSSHVDADLIDVDRLLIPELRDCHTICIANKQKNDTVYFSGVNVDQFIFFLKMLHYPREIIEFVEDNRGKLDHLLYDVGFDFVARGADVQYVKSGYYGVF
ncbi:MAG: hypothetical protein NZO58_01545 [Gemmataceae bacterium]|nr:hypothetical protein [Gemmataceae bacterium]